MTAFQVNDYDKFVYYELMPTSEHISQLRDNSASPLLVTYRDDGGKGADDENIILVIDL